MRVASRIGGGTSPVSELEQPSALTTPVSGRISWSTTELQEICRSASRIGQAFLVQTGRSTTPQIMFMAVMGVEVSGWIDLIRVDNRPNCITDNNVRTITCGNLIDAQGQPRAITQYVIAHEFGHVFDNEADRGNGRSLRDYIADTRVSPILDANNNIVMGSAVLCSNTWLRGERGWGSGPGSRYNPLSDFCNPQSQVFTDFQQNTAPYNTDQQANEETAADMFLNWVYYKLWIRRIS